MKQMIDIIYYESHITIDPLKEEIKEEIEKIARSYKFKIANLLMDKGIPSQLDSFMTGIDKERSNLENRTIELLLNLKKYNINIRRYKIEAIILDSRHDDIFDFIMEQDQTKMRCDNPKVGFN